MMFKEYLHEVRALINFLRDVLSDTEVSEVEHLVDHNEPAEGLRSLAWIIYDEKKNVDNKSVTKILSLIGDMIPETHLPPDFKNYGRG